MRLHLSRVSYPRTIQKLKYSSKPGALLLPQKMLQIILIGKIGVLWDGVTRQVLHTLNPHLRYLLLSFSKQKKITGFGEFHFWIGEVSNNHICGCFYMEVCRYMDQLPRGPVFLPTFLVLKISRQCTFFPHQFLQRITKICGGFTCRLRRLGARVKNFFAVLQREKKVLL